MNLNRVGNWAADDYNAKKKRIGIFLEENTEYINKINLQILPIILQRTIQNFINEYPKLKKKGLSGPTDNLEWAESMMTWGNILTHRCNLIK